MFSRLAACFVLLKIASFITGAPVEITSEKAVQEIVDCQNEKTDVYDQRQNGTENYRIHVNGMVVVVAPAEAVLQAAALGSLPMSPDSETSTSISQPQKPKPKPPTVTDKVPSESTLHETFKLRPKDKSNLKLLNLLQMFRSIKHDPKEIVQQ